MTESEREPETPKPSLPSLPEVHRSIPLPTGKGRWRRYLAFAGPGFLVSVGYMDPGNWATDLEGGSVFGYSLLWVVLLSNLMAILLQTLCVRLGLATGRDLAQTCRDHYKKPAAIALWLLCEIAIVACDLAEVIGSAVAISLLTGGRIPLIWGVLITGADVLAILLLTHLGFRKLEAVVLTLVGTVAGCFALEVFLSHPDWGGVAHGLFTPTRLSGQSLTIALGILGATVMPHNLYLHSALVQTRAHDRSRQGIRQAIRYNTLDTVVALSAAFFVNAAILVVAASVFRGGEGVRELEDAYRTLTPLLGGGAATAFAIALLASGQSSTITGTLAGQIVMEGFLHIHIAPWLRRLITRSLAVLPAIALILATGGHDTTRLLVLSQVVLSMQLSFAIFPLMLFTSDRRRMGEHVNPLWLKIVGYATCLLIAGLNLRLLYESVGRFWMAVLIGVGVAFAAWVRWFYRESPPASVVQSAST